METTGHRDSESPPTIYRGRVRSGCLTCRTRKVKCDEKRPVCLNCTRLKRTCTYKSNTTTRPPSKVTILPSETPASNAAQEKATLDLDLFAEGLNSDQLFSDHLFFTSTEPFPFELAENVITLEDTSIIQPPEGVFQQSYAPGPPLSSSHINNLSGIVPEDPDILSGISQSSSQDNQLSPLKESTNPGVSSPSQFSQFIELVEPPFITPCDPRNWNRMKIYITKLGMYNDIVSAAVLAVQALYVAVINGSSTTNAMSLYHAAKSIYGTTLDDTSQDFNNILVVTFLLCLFEVVTPHETISITSQSDGAFVRRLEMWSNQGDISTVSLRIEAWLTILHAKAMHTGGRGLLSERVRNLLSNNTRETPTLSFLDEYTDVTISLYDILSAPLFEVYLELQKISSQTSTLAHYHRGRGTPADEEEVFQVITHLKTRMAKLWQNRTNLLGMEPGELRANLAAGVAEPIITLVGICNAAYHTEIVEFGRTVGKPPLASDEAKEAMRQIRRIVDGNWNASAGGKINSGFLRPLFLYSIESMDRADTQWAIERMKRVNNPICRSDFFTSLASHITEEQISKGRRVHVKHFSSRAFGVLPPFI